MRRLSPIAGELLDRSQGLEFSFEGRRFSGYRGDTISSALAANGVKILGRSFKYHRPRGFLSAAGHDANTLMQVELAGRSVPNVRADVVPLEAGLTVRAVNTRGGLAHDRWAVLGHLGPFLPVGFYYKAFHSKRLFPRWERLFRRLAGLGEVDLRATRRHTPKRYDFCDVLVIGAGPSGLAAALGAAARGAQVLLVDESPVPGGSGLYARGGAATELEQTMALVAAVRAQPRIRLLSSTFAAGYYADHWVALIAPECMVKVRARSVVIAQGGYEQPCVFRGNDLPGVMLASAAQRLIYHHAVAPAQRVALLTANVQGYAAARDALANGIELAAVLDLRAAPGPLSQAAAAALAQRGVAVHLGAVPIEALPDDTQALARFVFESAGTLAASTSTVAARRHELRIDGLWMSVGFAPANALLHQAGARLQYAQPLEQFIPLELPPGVHACGKVNGVFAFAERVADGRAAGERAADSLEPGAEPTPRASPAPLAPPESPTHPYPVFAHPRAKEFVDFDEDLQIKDLVNACQEGFDSSELLKRFSTVGMGPSQGKHSNMNALRILARVRGVPLEALGTTTARPMFHPVPLAHLAGRGFTPERRTALDAEHERLGAVWMPAGNWRRPEYYRVGGKSRAETIAAEVRAVRTAAGLIDVGTLGKIEVHGPRAGEFLERIYTARFANLKVGMTRYGLMLDEAGVVVDDGVIGRLGPESFYFTTTTGNSATLFREFGRLASWWGMAVGLVNLTGHFSAFNLAGPAARAVLAAHTELDLSDAAFPYLGIREAQIAGAPCRLMRVGFVGELGYEIHLPAEYALDVWRALTLSGARFGLRAFGVEAQRMLRLEKGHLIVGQDTDGVTNALEIGAPWAIKMDKAFFIGQRSLRILEKQPRKQVLIGFKLAPDERERPRESHLIIDAGEIAGRVTSIGFSPSLERCIGLALVAPRLLERKELHIRIAPGREITANIVELPFYDPQGDRQRLAEPAVSAPAAAAAPLPAIAQGAVAQGALAQAARRAPLAASAHGPGGATTAADARLRLTLLVRERFGCKGPGAEHWLAQAGFAVPQAPNSALITNGVLVARLATSEFLIEALHGGADAVAAQRGQLASHTRPREVYPVVRQDVVIGLGGPDLGRLLRQICSVDFAAALSAPDAHSGPVFLTSMIGVGVVAHAHPGEDGQSMLSVWADPSFAHYFWTTLLEIARDMGGVEVIAP